MDRITTPFGFHSTAAEVAAGVDLTGKRAIVTGASAGIGVETARALAGTGAEVTLAVRDTESGQRVAMGLMEATRNPAIFVRRLDLASQSSVHAFVAGWVDPLHILVNNAGIMALPALERTGEGWEMQFATNFLGHFALTIGLRDALAAAGGARVVAVSSSANLISPVVFDDIHFDFRPYDPLVAYGQSKTANVLLAVEVTRRWAAQGIFANALNPGAIPTNLQKHTGGLKTPAALQKSPQQGAATTVLLATSPLLHATGARYFEDCNEAQTVTRRPADYHGVAHYALDPGNAQRLWDTAAALVAKR